MLVETNVVDGVAQLMLNRPERRNALGTALMAALDEAVRAAVADSAVGALLIHGAAPAFCAGSDLKELAGLDARQMAAHEAETARITRGIGAAAKPVVAAVDGYALGGGLALAAACDVVVTTQTARWHMPEVANGWIPPWGLAPLVDRLGRARAQQLLLAEPMDGKEALAFGLADHAVAAISCLDFAQRIASRIAGLPRAAVASTKRYFATSAEELDRLAGELFVADCASPEAVVTFAKFGARA